MEFIVIPQANQKLQRVQVDMCAASRNAHLKKETYTVTLPVTCEGVAHLTAEMGDGSKFKCNAGYVTRGFGHTVYRLTMLEDGCTVQIIAGSKPR